MNKEEKTQNVDAKPIWDKLEEAEKKVNEGFDAVITNVEPMTNDEYFGTSGYDVRDGMKITLKVENDETFDTWYSTPSVRGVEKSNVFAFKKKYGSYPKPELPVTVIIGDNGFFKIKLDD